MKQLKFTSILSLFVTLFLVSCAATSSTSSNSSDSSSTDATDITDAIFTSQSANCADYVKSYTSSAKDVNNNNKVFTGSLTISTASGKCSFTSTQIPNHDFNDGSSKFVTDVASSSKTYSISASPTAADSVTELSLSYDNALFLNGVKLDLLSAGCFEVGTGKIGCNDNYKSDQYWRYDPMYSGNNFGTDSHNAHTQPTGEYHYHGDPKALYDTSSTTKVSPVIGFAADGYPVFGPYFKDSSNTIRKAVSCYVTKTGSRQALSDAKTTTPAGSYDGTYIQDYEYDLGKKTDGTCDLDECNGMTVNNVYGYYVTDSYPWVLKCFKGTLDPSFKK